MHGRLYYASTRYFARLQDRPKIAVCTFDGSSIVETESERVFPNFGVYQSVSPRQCQACLVEAHLNEKRGALQDLLREADRLGMMKAVQLGEDKIDLFKNINYPSDL